MFVAWLGMIGAEPPVTFASPEFELRVSDPAENEESGEVSMRMEALDPREGRRLWSREVTADWGPMRVQVCKGKNRCWVVVEILGNHTEIQVYRCTEQRAAYVFTDVVIGDPKASVTPRGLDLDLSYCSCVDGVQRLKRHVLLP